jgi:hypothetical protein
MIYFLLDCHVFSKDFGAQLLCRVPAYTRPIACDDLPTINDRWTTQNRHSYPHKFAACPIPASHGARAARLATSSLALFLALAEPPVTLASTLRS